jgi:hypothetical protein
VPPPRAPPPPPPQGGGGLDINRFQDFKSEYFNRGNVAVATAPPVVPPLVLSVGRVVAAARAADAAIARAVPPVPPAPATASSLSTSSLSTWAQTPASSPRDMATMEAYLSPPSYKGSPLIDIADIYRRYIYRFVRHPVAMFFLSTPREPLRPVSCDPNEPTSHLIRCYDHDEEDLCFSYDFDSQEWINEYDSQFSRSRQPHTRFCA